MSLNLDEIRRQQRRVGTLLQGDPNSMPPLTNHRRKKPGYPDVITRRKLKSDRSREIYMPLYGSLTTPPSNDDVPSSHLEQLPALTNKPSVTERTQDIRGRKPLLPSIESNGNRFMHLLKDRSNVYNRGSLHFAGATVGLERQFQGSLESTRKPKTMKENAVKDFGGHSAMKSSKPTVKYKHQKVVPPSSEDRWKSCAAERLERIRAKANTKDIHEERSKRDYSNLSSISDISARQRQLAEKGYSTKLQDTNSNNKTNNPISRDCTLFDLPEVPDFSIDSYSKNRHQSYHSMMTSKSDIEEETLKDDDFRVHFISDPHIVQSSVKVSDDTETFTNNPNRLPDIRISWQPQVTLVPETRKWNPYIGETTRAFVFSYFDHLPLLKR